MDAGPDSAALAALLQRWTAAGLIDAQLAERMRADVAGPDDMGGPAGRRRAVAVEALAYLGSAVVVVGAALIAAEYWSDLATGARFVVVAGTSVVLLLAGALVPGHTGAAWARLRAVLFLASTAAFAGALAVLADDVLGLPHDHSLVVVAAVSAAHAAALWLVTRSPAQQVGLMVAGAVTAAALINRGGGDPDLPGLGVWGVGVAWAVLAWTGVLRPRRLGLAAGTATAIFGAMTTAGSDLGLALDLATVGAAVALAILAQDLVVLGIAALGVVLNVPAAMQRWFPDSLSAAFALVVGGLSLVGVAVWIARAGRGVARSGGSAKHVR
jgi:hypothetical protein